MMRTNTQQSFIGEAFIKTISSMQPPSPNQALPLCYRLWPRISPFLSFFADETYPFILDLLIDLIEYHWRSNRNHGLFVNYVAFSILGIAYKRFRGITTDIYIMYMYQQCNPIGSTGSANSNSESLRGPSGPTMGMALSCERSDNFSFGFGSRR